MNPKALYTLMYRLARLRWKKTGSFDSLKGAISPPSHAKAYSRALDHLQTREAITVVDGFINRERAARFRQQCQKI